jgi:hypothetical protein
LSRSLLGVDRFGWDEFGVAVGGQGSLTRFPGHLF